MVDQETLEIGGLVLGGLVFVALAYGVARVMQKLGAIFPDAAKHYGLAYTKEKQGGGLANTKQAERLQGVVDGVPLQVVATYETVGRTTIRGTSVATPAPAGWTPCTLNLARTAPAATFHLVATGDAAFDRRWFVTCDAPAMAQALLAPDVRAQLLRCPQPELRLVVAGGHVVLSFGGNPMNAAGLHGPIDAVLAMAKAGAR